MSTRFESVNSESAGRNGITVPAAWTFGGYFYLHSLPSAGAYAPIITVYGAFSGFSVMVDSAGKLRIYDYTGSVISSAGTATLATSTWYYLWVELPVTGGGNSISIYLNGSGTADLGAAGSSFGPARIEFATNQSSFATSYWADVSLDGWKGWSIDRAASNATAEMAAHALVSSTSAVGAWFLDGTDVTDHNGNVNDLTAIGTLSAGPDSPIDAAPASAPIGFVPGTKRPAGMPGPRDRLGFLRQQIWDYTLASEPAPSTVAQAAAAVAMSTAFAVGVAIMAAVGSSTSQSTAAAPATGIASGAGVTTAQSAAQAPATGIAAGAGVSVSQATGSAGSASTGAGSGASTAQSLARGTGAPTGAGGGCTTAQSSAFAGGSAIGAGSGISGSGGALAVAIGQAVVPGVGGVTVAQSTAVGSGAATGAGGGCTTSVSSARATSASIAAGAGTSSSQSSVRAAGASTSPGVGISVSQSFGIAAQGADIPTVEAAGLVLVPNDGRLSLVPNNGRLFLTPNNGALSLVPNDGTLSLSPDQ